MKVQLPNKVEKVLEIFEKEGFKIYIVGGAVRDLITKRPVDDWDFTTNATPKQIQKLLPDSFYDNKFGTIGISYDDFEKYG